MLVSRTRPQWPSALQGACPDQGCRVQGRVGGARPDVWRSPERYAEKHWGHLVCSEETGWPARPWEGVRVLPG